MIQVFKAKSLIIPSQKVLSKNEDTNSSTNIFKLTL